MTLTNFADKLVLNGISVMVLLPTLAEHQFLDLNPRGIHQKVTLTWWWWWIVFLVWLTDERRLALFSAGIIVRDPQQHESPTGLEQDLNLRRTWVEWSSGLVEWSCAVRIKVHTVNGDFQAILNFHFVQMRLFLIKLEMFFWFLWLLLSNLLVSWCFCFIINEVKNALMATFQNNHRPFINKID